MAVPSRARRRSFYLSPQVSLAHNIPISVSTELARRAINTPQVTPSHPPLLATPQAGLITASLLNFSRQVSAFAFAFLGCVPGPRGHKRAEERKQEQAAISTTMPVDAAESSSLQRFSTRSKHAEPDCDGAEFSLGTITDYESSMDNDDSEKATDSERSTAKANVLFSAADTSAHAASPCIEPTASMPIATSLGSCHHATPSSLSLSSVASPNNPPDAKLNAHNSEVPATIALGPPAPSPRESSPIQLTQPSLSPEHDQRLDIIRQVRFFTSARLARRKDASVPPPARTAVLVTPPRPGSPVHVTPLDDPFSSTPSRRSRVAPAPANVNLLRLCLRTQLQEKHGGSPTPRERSAKRPPLRQQTVFFKQPLFPTTANQPPTFWKPRAGSPPIVLRSPEAVKENVGMAK